MKTLATTALDVLDLATYPQGGTIAGAFELSRELAQSAERWGYKRYWVAEHHGGPHGVHLDAAADRYA